MQHGLHYKEHTTIVESHRKIRYWNMQKIELSILLSAMLCHEVVTSTGGFDI